MRKSGNFVINRIPITKARINLGRLAKRAHLNNEYFILEKDGIPIVGLMDADELEDYLELQDPTVKEFIAESHKDYIAGHSRPAEELLAQLKQQTPGKTKSRKRAKVWKRFTVLTTPLFDRLLAKLVPQHPELPDIFESAIAILKTDPHNLSRRHPIKKLRGINPGNGQ